MTRIRTGSLPWLLLLALAVAGCGGGGRPGGVTSLGGADQPTSTTNAGASGGYDLGQALAFARCMRQHGINLPDPKVTAEGIDQPPAPGMHRNDPRQQAAERACSPRGGGGK